MRKEKAGELDVVYIAFSSPPLWLITTTAAMTSTFREREYDECWHFVNDSVVIRL